MDRRVVITGMGIYSCIGQSLGEVAESLYLGKSGIIFDPVRREAGFRSSLTGMVEKPNLKGVLDRRERISMSEEASYAYMATKQALEQARIDPDYLEHHEVGIMYGNDSSADAVVNSVDIMREKKDTTLVGSGAIFQSMTSTVTMNLSVIFKLKGINLTISAACASGSHSIGLASLLVRMGLQDIIVCGGAQEINMPAVGSFDGISAFSIREDEPAKASRPFDRDRDGLVPSGGAATLIIESYESAMKRGAPILAEVLGYGFSSNGDHISVPNVGGPVRSLEMAIRASGVNLSDITYVNAHATSTLVGDSNEAKALSQVFGSTRPWVASTKSMTGHEMWMAGASEVIYSVLMMQRDFVAANINFENPDEDTAALRIPTKTINTVFDCFLSNSFGFGGTNSSLVIKKTGRSKYKK